MGHEAGRQGDKPNAYLVAGILILSAAGLVYTFSQPSKEVFVPGQVKEIISEREVVQELNNKKVTEQELRVEIISGGERKEVSVLNDFSPVEPGDKVFIRNSFFDNEQASVVEIAKTEGIVWLSVFFVVLVLLTAGQKGFYALVGLIFSLAVIFVFIVPAILRGGGPIFIGLAGSTMILIPTLYLSYGFSKKTVAALIGIITSLFFVGVLANLTVSTLNFTGFTEESLFLNIETDATINLVGLLIAGIIIAAVGVLDDVAVTQASTVFNLISINPELHGLALFRKAMAVGKDHISAVVNTLVLAYTGAALPLVLLLFYRKVPLDYFISMEIVAEEIVRTLVSSAGLLLAVPLTTVAAVLLAKRGE